MLSATFQHIRGIGAKKESEYWGLGVVSWDDLELRHNPQLSLFTTHVNGKSGIFSPSRRALKERNAEFFAKELSRQEHYRIALTFPSETLFLDIETTGLSRYYDTVTVVGWSINGEYNSYIKGGDERLLRTALRKAKVIVTFNGTLFDLPFLRQEFPDLQIPVAHVDLRFLARRVGLAGGQKKIESLIGVKRPTYLENLAGETAPLLWYKALRGDQDALSLLIAYNHADVEGMRLIFDFVVSRLLEKHAIPPCLRSVHRFVPKLHGLTWPTEKTYTLHELRLNQAKVGRTVSLEDLALSQELSQLRIVGIDLTGSEDRPSGWCLLEGDHAFTHRLGSNADLIKATLDAQPTLVSIDSPLSLPQGRMSVSDDDPGRRTYGIMRYCERVLKKRGINVYPSLIRSMQGLTARGIRLAKQLRGMGIPVIESYPGAAQDIMKIPRKRASLEFLEKGLAEFGIRGDFLDHQVSHDELDAITSALVGLFFWSGKFEALGNPEEEYLIIPDIKANPHAWRSREVIGLSGPIAVGKTTAGEFLQSLGFHYGRFSLVLADVLQERGVAPSREALQKLGEEVNKDPGQRWLCQQLIRKLPGEENLVIDGLRFPEDHATLVEAFGPAFFHIHIDSPNSTRRERFIATGGTSSKFVSASAHPVEVGVAKLATLAHAIVSNDGTKESFLSKILKLVGCEKNRREEASACR